VVAFCFFCAADKRKEARPAQGQNINPTNKHNRNTIDIMERCAAPFCHFRPQLLQRERCAAPLIYDN